MAAMSSGLSVALLRIACIVDRDTREDHDTKRQENNTPGTNTKVAENVRRRTSP
jgi:hypothetical protein